ncbi:MAG: hypothetical protein HOV80_26445, partial [Polyangiaceae bacterium]|nr:hypothetical protein [Polyangiaceae bacterium]
RARLRRDQLGDRQGAAADLKKLHDLSPSDAEVMNELSSLLEQLGDHKGRIQLFEDQILRGRDPAQRAELARKVARLWEEELGDAREAADAWRRVLRMKANDAEATSGLERAKAGKLNHNPTPVVAAPIPPAPLTRQAAPTASLLEAAMSGDPEDSFVSDPGRNRAPEPAPTRLDAAATSAALAEVAATTGPNEVFKGIPEETADSDDAEQALADVPARPDGYDLVGQPTPVVPLEALAALSGEVTGNLEGFNAAAEAAVPQAEPSSSGYMLSESSSNGEIHAAISTRPPTIPPGPRVDDAFLGSGDSAPAETPAASEVFPLSGATDPGAPAQDSGDWAQQQQHAAWQQQQQQQQQQQGGWQDQAAWQQSGWQQQQHGQQGYDPQQQYPEQGATPEQAAWAQQQQAHAWAQQHAGWQQQQTDGWAQQQGQYPQVNPAGWQQQQQPQQQQGWEQQQQAWQQQQQPQEGWQQQPQQPQQGWGQQQGWEGQHPSAPPGPVSRPPAPASKPPAPGSSRPPQPGDEDIEDVDDAELIEDEP